MTPHSPILSARRSEGGYLLVEVIIAVAIFSLSFVGLMRVLRQSQDAAGQFAFEAHLRTGLEAILAEARNRPLSEMAREETDSLLGIVYQTEIEPLTLNSEEGTLLRNLYLLRARATYDHGQGPEEDIAELWIYRSEDEPGS